MSPIDSIENMKGNEENKENIPDLSAVISKPEPTLMGVPLEVREKIFQYWLHSLNSSGPSAYRNASKDEVPDGWLFWPKWSNRRRWKTGCGPLSLLLANKQVYEEANRAFWHIFRFGFEEPLDALQFIDSLPKNRLSRIRHIYLQLMPQLKSGNRLPNEEQLLWHLIPDLEDVRAKLPSLRSVAFYLDGEFSWDTEHFVRAGIRNFQCQIAPFRNVERVYVRYGNLDQRPPIRSRFFRLKETLSKEGDKLSDWLVDTEVAMRSAYEDYLRERGCLDSVADFSTPSFQERFPRMGFQMISSCKIPGAKSGVKN